MADADKKRKVAAQTGMYMVVIAIIVVLANAFSASGGYVRKDATLNGRFTLSEGSKNLVRSMKGVMTVEAYLTRTNLARQNTFIDDLTHLLKAYETNSNGKFKFTLIDPKTEELKERAKDAGLQEIPMGETSDVDSEAQIAQGYMGLVLKYGSEKEVQPLGGNTHGLEFFLSNKIRGLRDKVDGITHKIGVITGKEELKLDDGNLLPKQGGGRSGPTLKGIINQYFPFYEIEDVDLKEGNEEIKAELDGLIITQPGKEYTDAELRAIDRFLMLGNKAVAVFASAANLEENDAKMKATLNTNGLDKLLAGYGINMKKDIVYDYGARFEVQALTQAGPVRVPHPGIALVTDDQAFTGDQQLLDTGFAGFFQLPQLVFPFASSLEILKDKQPEAEIKVLARTTPSAVTSEEAEQDLRPRREWQADSSYDQKIISAVVEGKLKSAFGDGPEGAAAQAPEPSRVFVVASGLFLTNPFSYAGNGPEMGQQFQMFGNVGGDKELLQFAGAYAQGYLEPTILTLKNTLDWLTGDLDLVATSAKISSEPNLKYSSIKPPVFDPEKDDQDTMKRKSEDYRLSRKSLQTTIGWSLTLGMPFGFGLFGLLRWNRRNRRRSEYKV